MKTIFSGKEYDSDNLSKEQALFLVSNFENDALTSDKVGKLIQIVNEAGGLVERYNGTSKLISFNPATQVVGEF